MQLTSDLQLLGSAYALGADSDQLKRSYEHEITQLVPIARGFIRGDVISKENWRDFLNRKEFVVPDDKIQRFGAGLLTMNLGILLHSRTFSTAK